MLATGITGLVRATDTRLRHRRPEEGRKPGVKGIGHPEPNGTLPKTLIPQKIAPAPGTKGRLQRRPAGIVHAPEPPMRVFGTVRATRGRRGKTNARPGSDGRGRQAPQMACSTNLVPHQRPRRSKDIEKSRTGRWKGKGVGRRKPTSHTRSGPPRTDALGQPPLSSSHPTTPGWFSPGRPRHLQSPGLVEGFGIDDGLAAGTTTAQLKPSNPLLRASVWMTASAVEGTSPRSLGAQRPKG